MKLSEREIMPNHPLAEVFGFPTDNFTPEADRHRDNHLCPFHNNVQGRCTKSSIENPIGVCSVLGRSQEAVITCPSRFRQDWRIASDAAKFFFPNGTRWQSLPEVRLNDQAGESAGNIDLVLAAYDQQNKILDYGAVEVQSVYISGNVSDPFLHYMEDPKERAHMNWRGQPKYPRPDFLSSSRKRLAPQLISKGGILNAWGRKMAVVLDKHFFNTLPVLEETDMSGADMAWLVYDLRRDHQDNRYQLELSKTVYTKFESALLTITRSEAGAEQVFTNKLQMQLNRRLRSNASDQ